jgi:hypothetical protein
LCCKDLVFSSSSLMEMERCCPKRPVGVKNWYFWLFEGLANSIVSMITPKSSDVIPNQCLWTLYLPSKRTYYSALYVKDSNPLQWYEGLFRLVWCMPHTHLANRALTSMNLFGNNIEAEGAKSKNKNHHKKKNRPHSPCANPGKNRTHGNVLVSFCM